MAWIRLDDQIAHHPKVLKVGLSAWLYVASIAFSQRFLTDGFVPDGAIPTLCGGVEKPMIHIRKLITAGLLEKVEGGFQVHDYLDFNESSATVKKRREDDRNRKKSERIPTGFQEDSGRIPAGVLARAPASSPLLSDPKIPRIEEQASLETCYPNTNGNGKHRAQTYQRTPIIGKNAHLKHIACDSTLSYCVPDSVHHKLASLLAPKHAGDHDHAAEALLAWYPTVWAKLVNGFVMGDAFKFWQGQFDTTFATPNTVSSLTASNLAAGARWLAKGKS